MEHPHREEIIKYARADYGTTIWRKMYDDWKLWDNVNWDKECQYIINDEYAELRKAQRDGAIIEARINHASSNSCSYGEESPWNTEYTEFYWNFSIGVENYRIKPKPISKWKWVKMIDGALIVSEYCSALEANKSGYHKDWTRVESSIKIFEVFEV